MLVHFSPFRANADDMGLFAGSGVAKPGARGVLCSPLWCANFPVSSGQEVKLLSFGGQKRHAIGPPALPGSHTAPNGTVSRVTHMEERRYLHSCGVMQ